jgi:hypothetical protein
MAGPQGWNPIPDWLGFPIGFWMMLPLLSMTSTSGVKGLLLSKAPP